MRKNGIINKTAERGSIMFDLITLRMLVKYGYYTEETIHLDDGKTEEDLKSRFPESTISNVGGQTYIKYTPKEDVSDEKIMMMFAQEEWKDVNTIKKVVISSFVLSVVAALAYFIVTFFVL